MTYDKCVTTVRVAHSPLVAIVRATKQNKLRQIQTRGLNAILRRFGHRAAIRIQALLVMTILASTAGATVFYPTLAEFELSHNERHALEAEACRPFNVELEASIGFDFGDDDRESFSAIAHCARHANIYEHPVFFKRLCDYEGTWTCEKGSETVSARYSDRRVHITAEGVSLTEAYQIVSYFVLHKLFEPADVLDSLVGEESPPLDNCSVRALEGNELELKCQLAERRVARTRHEGRIRYRQIPLPWCATTDNDACVYGP